MILLAAAACVPVIRKDARSGRDFEIVVSPPQAEGLVVFVFREERGATAPHISDSWQASETTRPVLVRPLQKSLFRFPKTRDTVWMTLLPPVGRGSWRNYLAIVLAPGMRPAWTHLPGKHEDPREIPSTVKVEVSLQPYDTPALWLEELGQISCGVLRGGCKGWEPNSLTGEEQRQVLDFLCAEAASVARREAALSDKVRALAAEAGCPAQARHEP